MDGEKISLLYDYRLWNAVWMAALDKGPVVSCLFRAFPTEWKTG